MELVIYNKLTYTDTPAKINCYVTMRIDVPVCCKLSKDLAIVKRRDPKIAKL